MATTHQERRENAADIAVALGRLPAGATAAQREAFADEVFAGNDHEVEAMATTLLHRLGAGTEQYPAAA